MDGALVEHRALASEVLGHARVAFDAAALAMARRCSRDGRLDNTRLDAAQVASFDLAWAAADLLAAVRAGDQDRLAARLEQFGRHGEASRRGLAAQARVRDALGRSHYLMVEPDLDDEVFEEGAQVLIVRKAGAFFRCIANPHPGLM